MVKKFLSVFIALLMISSFLSFTALAANTLTLTQLQSKFPDGTYWTGGNPDSYFTSKGKSSNSFDNASQCHGFALKLAYDAYGVSARTWSKAYNLNNLKAGDIIRYKNDGHSIWVTDVTGDTITYADCNGVDYSNSCQIRWRATISKSTIAKTLTYVMVSPYKLSTSNNNQIPPSSTIADGIYIFQSVQGGNLNIYAGKDVDGQNACIWQNDGSKEQKFRIVSIGNNKYMIYCICSNNGNGRVLDVYRGKNPLASGQNVDMYVANDPNAQQWVITSLGNGSYKIELAALAGVVLTSLGTKNNSNVIIQNYTGATSQQWKLIKQ